MGKTQCLQDESMGHRSKQKEVQDLINKKHIIKCNILFAYNWN